MPKKLPTAPSGIQIFLDYERWENRLPTKDEWDREYYGRVLRRGEGNYYYSVRKKFLERIKEEE